MQRYKLFLIQARKRGENDIVSYSECLILKLVYTFANQLK